MNSDDVITCTNRGLLVPNLKRSIGKTKKFIPWNMVEKTRVDAGIYKCESKSDNVACWHVRKEVNHEKLDRIYMTERDALKAVDLQLIKHGRDPKYILKKK